MSNVDARSPWRILVVDDDPDVHAVTRIAMRHRSWQRRSFDLVSAMNAKEALDIVNDPATPPFDVALVDVVMETKTAGLELCQYLRSSFPPSLRLVLRTGQPGMAPEEHVLQRYDIDYYIAKPDVTPDRLYAVLRACLRSSQDISTLLAYAALTKEIVTQQIQDCGRSMHRIVSLADLLVFMRQGLKFLELKHDARTLFIPNVNDSEIISEEARAQIEAPIEPLLSKLSRAHERSQQGEAVWIGPANGLAENSLALPFSLSVNAETVYGALYCEVRHGTSIAGTAHRLVSDATLFVDNWKIAVNTLHLQERIAREQMLRDMMYRERLQGIANMVAGVAHEINTPLGVANTANSMLVLLLRRLREPPGGGASPEKTFANIDEASTLITRNIERAHRLVESFKKLSVGQLTDRRSKVEVVSLVQECVESMRPMTAKKGLTFELQSSTNPLWWDGFPGHLSQVIINFIQNAARYAYPDNGGGKIDIRLVADPDHERMQLEFEDYGNGIATEICEHLFEPFMTTGRDQGGTGLGLAIVHNIVTNLLHGRIHCNSVLGQGTKFTLELPQVVPEHAPDTDAASARQKPLGLLLIQRNAVTIGQLERALQIQRSEGGKLGEILIKTRAITEETLRAVLAAQSGKVEARAPKDG